MPTSPFLVAVQTRAARISVSASATRKQGGGIIEPARGFLAQLELKEFATARESLFRTRLDKTTEDLAKTFPVASRSWGLARKLLNIFLRDALYTSYLRDRFQLQKSEAFLEVPLDSISAGRIYKEAIRGELPRWPGVKHNTEEVSALYQTLASKLAMRAGVARVHLDTYWWGERGAANEA